MKEFAHQDLRPVFHFSRFIFVLVLVLSVVISVVLWATVSVIVGAAVGLSIFVTCYLIFSLAYVSDRRYNSGEQSCNLGGYIAKSTSALKLLCQVIFCIPPCPNVMRSALPVRFLFTDFSKLTCSGSEAASLVGMIETLCDLVENDLGFFVTRLYRVFRAHPSDYDDTSPIEARWKRCCCCIPTFIVCLFLVSCALISGALFKVYGTDGSSVVVGVEVATASIVGIAALVHLPTFFSILYSLAFSQKKRISVVATQLGLKEEGFIHALKQEVELLTDLVNCVDGFSRHQTRVVILVDGLDSSEQTKVLQLLDSINLLFTDPEAPFVCLMALDPRVIVRAIDQSFSSILRESHISASDYLKSIVQLPFYLPEPKSNYTGVLPVSATALLDDLRGHPEAAAIESDRPTSGYIDDLEWDGEMLVLDSGAHRLSRDLHNCNGGLPGRVHPDLDLDQSMLYETQEGEERLAMEHHKLLEREVEMEERRRLSADLAQVLADNETINPSGVRRLMNIVSLICRLLRARGLEYSWKRLAAWASLVDGWPYKTSWLVLLIEDSNTHLADTISLKDLYEATLSAMPVINEVDCAVDGDPVYFETFLGSHEPLLNTGDVRKFLSCTVHLDPSLRRQMVECLQTIPPPTTTTTTTKSDTESVDRRSGHLQAGAVQTDKEMNLASLTIEDVCKQLSELEGLDPMRISTYQSVVTSNNINGKVLVTCDMNELAQVMNMTFGDWQLFRAWILTARYPQECEACHANSRCVSPGEMNCQLLKTSSGRKGELSGKTCREREETPSQQPRHDNFTSRAWDNASLLSSTRKSASSSTEQVAQENGQATSPLLRPSVPAIVLLPPSAPESEEEEQEEEEEDNYETTETDLEKDDKDGKEEVIEASLVAGPSDRRSLDELPPPPVIPSICFEEDNEFPAPPPVIVDLISFSEAEDEKKDRARSAGPSQEKVAHNMECACEMLQAGEPDVMSHQSSKNSLLFDYPDSEAAGRPAPIVLTMDRSGPVKSAQVVKRTYSSSNGSDRITPSFSKAPKPAPLPPPLSISANAQGLPPTNLGWDNVPTARPRSTSDMITENNTPSLAPPFKPWGLSAETGLAQCTCLPSQDSAMELKDLKHNHDEYTDFPPPPPPLEAPTQEDSPWVPLMQRFQVNSDASAQSDSDESFFAHRRPKPKVKSGSREPPKFRSYTPTSKPSYIGIKEDELKGAKSETRV